MSSMVIRDVFKIGERELICFVGAGGKTTSMFKLAHELKQLNKRVLVTTTTAIFTPREDLYDRMVLTNGEEHVKNLNQGAISKEIGGGQKGEIVVIGNKISQEEKLLGLPPQIVDEIYRDHSFDVILVEGDGSRRKPIKAPAKHEPVIPSRTTKVVGVIGLDSLGKEINEETVHRADYFNRITKRNIGDKIDQEGVIRLLIDQNGTFKNTPKKAECYILFNKGDIKIGREGAQEIVNKLRKREIAIHGFLIASMQNGTIYSKGVF